LSGSEQEAYSTLVKNTFAYSILTPLAIVIEMVSFGFLIRLLDQGLYGLLLVAGGLIWQFNFLQFGLSQSLERFIPKFFVEERDDDVAAAIGFTIVVFAGVGVVLGAAFAAFSFSNGGALFSDEHASLANRLFLLCGVFSPVLWPMQALSSVLVGYGRIKLDSVITLLATASRSGLLVGGAYLGWSIEALLIATMLNLLVYGLVRAFVMIRLVDKVRGLFSRNTFRVGREIFGYSGWLFLNSFAQAITSRFDQFIIGAFLSAEAVPIYWALMRVLRSIPIVGSIFKRPVVPIAAELFTRGGDVGLHLLATQGTRLFSAFLTPFIVMLILFAEPFLTYWGGATLGEYAWVVQLGAILQLPVVVRGMLVQAGLAKYSVARVSSLFSVGLAGLHVLLLIVACSFLDLDAAVLSWAIAHFVVSPWWVQAILVQLSFRPWDYYVNVLAGTFPALVVGAVLVSFLLVRLNTFEPLGLLLVGAGSTIILVLISFSLGIGRDARAYVLDKIARRM